MRLHPARSGPGGAVRSGRPDALPPPGLERRLDRGVAYLPVLMWARVGDREAEYGGPGIERSRVVASVLSPLRYWRQAHARSLPVGIARSQLLPDDLPDGGQHSLLYVLLGVAEERLPQQLLGGL